MEKKVKDYVEFTLDDDITLKCELSYIFRFEDHQYVILYPIGNPEYKDPFLMRGFLDGDVATVEVIEDDEEFSRVAEYVSNTDILDETEDVTNEEELYQLLMADKYSERPYETKELDEGMAVVSEVIGGWWKNRFLLNHNTKQAWEFMDVRQILRTITQDDIDWETLEGLPVEAVTRAQNLSFHFPSFIRKYKNGVAEVRWQINPDGMYYMDEDGYGMTDDEEITLYGFIDQQGKAVGKFRFIKDKTELVAMRKAAEQLVIKRKN